MKKHILIMLLAIPAIMQAQTATPWQLTQQFIGQWSGQATVDLGGQVFVLTYNMNFQSAVDGNAITMNEWFDDPTLGSFRAANLIGLNASDGLIHWFSVDNFGIAHEHTGSWVNPRHFYMVHQSLAGGQVYREEIHFRVRANNTRIEAELVATLDGVVVQTIAGTLYPQQTGNRINGNPKPNWVVFPNPAKGMITIQSDDFMDELVIVNEIGQEVYRNKPTEKEVELFLDTPGIYFVTMTRGSSTENRKLIVEGN